MKNLCKHFFGGGNFKHPASKSAKGTILSLLLAACTTFTACNSDESSLPTAGNQLKLSFGINAPQSRAIFTDTKLPDSSPVGVKLDGYADYANLVYTGSTTSGSQSWTSTTSVTLTDTKGTLYAYWPQSNTVSIDAIDVDMTAADQTDWLYATPVTDVNEDKASVAVTMNHALANINITINKGAYKGTGAISNITIQSDAFATGGTFNAAQAEPAFIAYSGEGEPLSRTVDITTGTATDIMVVPTSTEGTIKFTATVDDVKFTVTSAALTLVNGNSYQYTLNLSDVNTYMSIDGFTVTPWNSVKKDELTMEKVEVGPWANVENGVYAVSATGLPVAVEDADESCIAVALITDNQKIMIAKEDATNQWNRLYWGFNFYPNDGKDITALANIQDVTVAKADFNGKANTAAIIGGYTEHNVAMDSRDMCKVLETYNEGGYTDWYVPAAGQCYEIYTKKSDINAALTKIGGTAFNLSYGYWSSTEFGSKSAWRVNFDGYSVVDGPYSKEYDYMVRFVRDI